MAGGFRLGRVRFREGSGSGGSGPRGPSYRWKTSGDAVIEAEASDRDLVERMLSGQEEAFTEFFDGHFPRLYRFALARANYDADPAEEVAHTVMCRAVAKPQTYRGEALLFTWVCTFCRHLIAGWHSRMRRTPPDEL